MQASHDVDAAAESLRRIERERAVDEQRRTEWVRRITRLRIEEAFRCIDIERKALEVAPAIAGAAAGVQTA